MPKISAEFLQVLVIAANFFYNNSILFLRGRHMKKEAFTMAFCPNCGRPLGENEVCGCTQQNIPQNQGVPTQNQGIPNQNAYGTPAQDTYGMPAQDTYGMPAQNTYGYPNGQQTFDQQNYNQNQNMNAPKKKSNVGLIVVIIIIVLLVLCLPITGILAAILIPSMLGYTAKSNQASVNAAAKTILNSYSTTITEMDAEGMNISGTYVICSESDANINVPGDADVFYATSEKYFDTINDYTYFVVVQDGYVSYAACVENDGDTIGTYPNTTVVNEGPASFSGTYTDTDWDINDLYIDACEYLFSYY